MRLQILYLCGKPMLLQAVSAEGIHGSSYCEGSLIMESGLGRQLNTNTQGIIRRSRNNPKTLRTLKRKRQDVTCRAQTWQRILRIPLFVRGHAVARLMHCAATLKVAGSLEFFIDIILPSAVWRWGRLDTFMCRLPWNLGASTSWKPQGLSRSVEGLLSFCSTRRTAQNAK
jgi:hypothetical protein